MIVNDWIEIVQYNANIYQWPDNITIFQALNKLKGTAKMWYDSYVESELGWSQYTWSKWKSILISTFQSKRNAFKLLMDIVNHKPTEGCSLYDFYFEHLSIINKLKVNFSDSDKISLICGAIDDSNIISAIETSNMSDLNLLSAYLKNKIYKSPSNTTQNNFRSNSTSQCMKNKNQISIHQPSTSKQPFVDKSKLTCIACGKIGHDRSLCRHKHQICNFCHIKGHLETNCLKKT